MIVDPIFYVLAVPAILIVGISKGGFGGGLGLLGVPVMSLAVAPPIAAAVMLPILCVMDLVGLWAYRRSWDRRNMARLIPAAVLGIAVGAASFRYLDVGAVRLLIGTIAVGFTLDYWTRSLRRRETAEPRRPSTAAVGFWGSISGFTSFVAHAGGAPLSVVLLPQRLDKTVFVSTTVIFFAVVNYIKLIPYAWLGQLNATNLVTSAILLPLAPLGVLLGIWLHHRLDEAVFYRICYVLLFLTGIKLLYDGVASIAI